MSIKTFKRYISAALPHAPRRQAGAALPGYTAPGRCGSFSTLALTFFAVALATNGAIAHVVPLLMDRGIPHKVAARAMAFAGIGLTGGRLLAGYLLTGCLRKGAVVVTLNYRLGPLGFLAHPELSAEAASRALQLRLAGCDRRA